jgi:SulP family sulfate permease
MLHRTSKPHFAVLENIKGTDYFRNINRFPEDHDVREDLLIVRFDDQLYFGNCSFFKRQLFKYVKEKGSTLKAVILNAEPINYIDSTATKMLLKTIAKLRDEGKEFYITGAIGPLRDIIFSSELQEVIPKSHLFVRIMEAVAYHDGKEARSPIQQKVTQQRKKIGN